MKRLILYLLIIIPLLGSCQKKYNAPPYNKYEADLRKLPQDINRIIIYKDWQKMDSTSYLRLKNVQSIVVEPKVDSLPSWIYQFKKLHSIWSFSKDLKIIPELKSDEISSIHHLTLDNSKIVEIPSSLCRLSNLESISFMNNQIDKVPDCIDNLKNLKKINLYNNHIIDLPNSIYSLPKLEEIILKGNPLKNPEEIKKRFEEKGVKVLLK